MADAWQREEWHEAGALYGTMLRLLLASPCTTPTEIPIAKDEPVDFIEILKHMRELLQ